MVIRVDRPDSDDGRSLIQRPDEDLRQRYPAVAIHGLRPQDLADPHLTFLVASVDGQAIDCGIARHILRTLESTARERGYTTLRLETGIRQPEAIRLYRSAGYVEIPCFGEYADGQFCVRFEKRLA